MKMLLVGYGKMGRLVAQLASEAGGEVVGVIDPFSPSHSGPIDDERWNEVDVAIDFTTADAVATNLPVLARRGIKVVVGTTGWQAHEAELRGIVEATGSGVVAAPNFSVGVLLFDAIAAYSASLFAGRPEFGAYLHEAHHAAKKDAPSGTALWLRRSIERAGYTGPVDVSSTRAGFIPGVHTVGFDGPSESITLTHAARDRGAFARGALLAARWLQGRRGWFTMHDVLGLSGPRGAR